MFLLMALPTQTEKSHQHPARRCQNPAAILLRKSPRSVSSERSLFRIASIARSSLSPPNALGGPDQNSRQKTQLPHRRQSTSATAIGQRFSLRKVPSTTSSTSMLMKRAEPYHRRPAKTELSRMMISSCIEFPVQKFRIWLQNRFDHLLPHEPGDLGTRSDTPNFRRSPVRFVA